MNSSTEPKPRGKANLAGIKTEKGKTYYVADVALMLDLSKRTIRYYVKKGWLQPVQYNSVRLQFTADSLVRLREVMESRMEKERMRRSVAMKDMRQKQMAKA